MFSIARNLVYLDAGLVAIVLVYAVLARLPFTDILPFALILLVASVPVALPATFTLSTALGAQELAKEGVLVTRLSAIEEAADCSSIIDRSPLSPARAMSEADQREAGFPGKDDCRPRHYFPDCQ